LSCHPFIIPRFIPSSQELLEDDLLRIRTIRDVANAAREPYSGCMQQKQTFAPLQLIEGHPVKYE
jgi:hypothetical protein